MRVAVLSNFTVDFITGLLKKKHQFWSPPGFNQWVQECFEPSASLIEFDPECIFVILDGRMEWSCGGGIDLMCSAVDSLLSRFPNVLVLLSDVDVPHVQIRSLLGESSERGYEIAWWSYLTRTIKKNRNVVMFGLKQLIEDIGRNCFYDARLRYAGGFPYSMAGCNAVAEQLDKVLLAYRGCRKKCIALDMDNTLWKGVIGEEGISGIKLAPDKDGVPFTDFQKRLKELKQLGVLLICLSKNNAEDVSPIWSDGRMILKKEDFVAFAVNWDAKPANLRKIAKMLNLGLDSFVFIDDNPAEREQMRHECPEVVVPDFPYDSAELESFAVKVAREYFLTVQSTDEDARKTEQYIEEAERNELKSSCGTVSDYLKKLCLKVRVSVPDEIEYERVAQLSQKTNQFNVTTNRYTVADIRRFAEDIGYKLLAARSSDRFGDNGLIGFVLVKLDGASAEILDFVMSCRVMNRTIEMAIESVLEEALINAGVRNLCATYKKTHKNAPVEKLFDNLSFRRVAISEDGKTISYSKVLNADSCIHHYVFIEKE